MNAARDPAGRVRRIRGTPEFPPNHPMVVVVFYGGMGWCERRFTLKSFQIIRRSLFADVPVAECFIAGDLA